MTIDTSIYGMLRGPKPLPNPMEQAGQAMQLRQLMGQGRLQDLQFSQALAASEREGQVRDLFARGDVTPEKLMAIDPNLGLTFQKNKLDADKTKAETDGNRMRAFVSGVGLLKDRLATVRDEASYQAYRQSAATILGDDAAKLNLPERFDPQWVARQMVESKELFTPKPQLVDMPDGSKQTIDMNPFTNPQATQFRAAPGMTPAQLENRRHNQVVEGQGAARMAWEGIPQATPATAPVAAPVAAPGVSPKEQAELAAKRAADAPKALQRVENAKAKADVVIGAIDGALKQVKNFRWFGKSIPGSGLRRAVGSMVPGTDAYDLQATVDTVIGNLGFKELQAMREASPTGGALGQVAVKELEMLQSTIASLKVGQGQEQLEENLAKVKKHFTNWKNAVEEAYKQEYGGSAKSSAMDVQGNMKANGIKFLGFEQ